MIQKVSKNGISNDLGLDHPPINSWWFGMLDSYSEAYSANSGPTSLGSHQQELFEKVEQSFWDANMWSHWPYLAIMVNNLPLCVVRWSNISSSGFKLRMCTLTPSQAVAIWLLSCAPDGKSRVELTSCGRRTTYFTLLPDSRFPKTSSIQDKCWFDT